MFILTPPTAPCLIRAHVGAKTKPAIGRRLLPIFYVKYLAFRETFPTWKHLFTEPPSTRHGYCIIVRVKNRTAHYKYPQLLYYRLQHGHIIKRRSIKVQHQGGGKGGSIKVQRRPSRPVWKGRREGRKEGREAKEGRKEALYVHI
jgi:hypothetical protein